MSSLKLAVALTAALVVAVGCWPALAADGSDRPLAAAARCESLAGATLAGAVLESAQTVPASPASVEHCHVRGSIEKALKFEVRLPSQWNKKILYTGGGGWDGYIDLTYHSAESLAAGYVQVASNGGHLSTAPAGAEWTDARPFLNNPKAQEMFGTLSIHTVLQVVKALVKVRYAGVAERYYYEGCSNGGREGLIQATKFPHDFDGIVVRAPAWNLSKLLTAVNSMSQRWGKAPLSAAKGELIATAVVDQCDALDGVRDGMVHNVSACHFDPAEIACRPGRNSATCLTPQEVIAERARMAPVKFDNGELIYPGWDPGSEYRDPSGLPGAEFQDYAQFWGTDGKALGGLETMAEGYVKYWVTSDPLFDRLAFNPNQHKAAIALTSTILDATPDLATYFKLGGKLILIHGTDDNAISYRSSIDYFNAVASAVGGESVRDQSMAFFLAPGVLHCLGGRGPDQIDLLPAVAHWVEDGRRPSAVGGLTLDRRDAAGKVKFSRPLCQYPLFARYKGGGDIDLASSYSCAEH